MNVIEMSRVEAAQWHFVFFHCEVTCEHDLNIRNSRHNFHLEECLLARTSPSCMVDETHPTSANDRLLNTIPINAACGM